MPDARSADHEIDAMFLDRQSPRSFIGEEVPEDELMAMFEAARWAPSSSNVQPWRFVYAHRNTPEWGPMFECLMPMNQRWAEKAGVLIAILSEIHLVRDNQRLVSPTHSFDAGSAWMSFALQASTSGYATHGMGGFFQDKARTNLRVPDDFHIDTFVAVGKRGSAEALPDDLKEREIPTQRRPLKETLFVGAFGGTT